MEHGAAAAGGHRGGQLLGFFQGRRAQLIEDRGSQARYFAGEIAQEAPVAQFLGRGGLDFHDEIGLAVSSSSTPNSGNQPDMAAAMALSVPLRVDRAPTMALM